MTTTTATTTAKKTLPTHELFDVQERENKRAFWNKVGAAFLNKDGSHSVLVYQPGIATPRRLQLRAIDRAIRPVKDGADPNKAPTHELFVVIDADHGSKEWKRVGVGFTNKDGSLSLIVDDGLRDGPKARFQLRARRDAGPSEPTTERRGDNTPAATTSASPRVVVRKRAA
jgi:hypothetical protein